VNTTYGYDNLSHLLSVTHAKGGVTLDGATYTLDNAGNRNSKNDLYAGVTTNYGYDNIYELLSAAQGGTTKESYTYDPVGNRLTALGSAAWSYNTSNELTARPSFSYTYDLNGNTQTNVGSAGTTTYNWDYENRLTSVVLPGSGGTVSFKYDPFGRRIYKSSTSGTSVYAYDGDNLVEETNGTGVVVARYSQGLNIDEPLVMLRSGTSSYYQADGLGSLTSVSNTSGALANTYTYDSFGNLTASTGSITNSFRYTGREFDTETSLYYYRARYYDASQGRFINEDPLRFWGGGNFYRYGLNNGTGLVDPTGLCPTPWYQTCTAKAIGGFALDAGIDAIGLLPEGGALSKAIGNYAGYRGIVATQQGTKALQGVKFGAGIVTTGLGAENTSWMGAGKTVVGVAGLVPVLGQAAAAVSIVLDGVQAGLEIAKCY
jgi:RHS repeat-associated protein